MRTESAAKLAARKKIKAKSIERISVKALKNVVVAGVNIAIPFAILLFFCHACGKARAGNSYSSYVFPTPGGYTCFVISDGDGKVIGANCK